jgi:hypothetical protein
MRGLVGVAWFIATLAVILLLRPRDSNEKPILRFPGAWIVVGLLLTASIGASVDLMVTGFGILR